jgi:hypothetical protein
MYITVTWTPTNGGDPVDIESEIVAAVTHLEFTNVLPVHDGLLLADIKKGEDAFQLQELQQALLDALTRVSFSWVVTLSRNGAGIASSPDMPRPELKKVADYET